MGVATLKRGTEVRVLGQEGKWCKVRAQVGETHYLGYVWGGYLAR